jgi:hypothetical protein
MATQHNCDNPLTTLIVREAPSKAEFKKFQQMMLPSIQRLLETLERLQREPVQNHRDNDAHDDDGIRVRPIHHCHPALINRPPTYDNFSNGKDFIEGVFGRNVGVDQRGGGRGGTGFGGCECGGANFIGNAYVDASYRGAYG